MAATTSNANHTTMGGRLSRIIEANGRFSVVSGALLLAAAVVLDGWFDLPAAVIAVVGAALIPYGLMLRRSAALDPFDYRLAWLATIGDLTWVIAAIVLLVIPNTMSATGKWTLAIVTLAVLEFAVLQLRELRWPRTGRQSVSP
jgi:hypothetical protein